MYFDLVREVSRVPNPKLIWLRDDQRIELSGVTLANGISKAANFLIDSWNVSPGATIRFAVEAHWQSSIWLNAALSVGAQINLTEGGDFAICAPDRSAEVVDAEEIGQLSSHPFGLGQASDDPFVTDLATEVRAHGDYFGRPVLGSGLAITAAEEQIAYLQLAAAAQQMVAQHAGHNLAINAAPDSIRSALVYATVPLVSPGSVLIVDGPISDELLERENASEVAG